MILPATTRRPSLWGLKALLILAALGLLAAAAASNLEHWPIKLKYGLPARVLPLEIGKLAGLMAAMLLMIQFALSGRFKLLDRAFPLDRLLRVHAIVGATAAVLVLAHVLLLFATGLKQWDDVPAEKQWALWVGIAAVVLIAGIVATSLWRKLLRIPYRLWWWMHQGVFCVVMLAAVHALALGVDLRGNWAQLVRFRQVPRNWPFVFWVVCLGAYAAAFVWVKIARPLWLRARRFTVAAVTRVSHNTVTIELERPGRPFRHEPGQFAFLRLYGGAVGVEEHPFTIAGSPAEPRLRFTVKASGDYTRRIGEVAVGDRATVDGPYGHFSYRFKHAPGLLMIAGGVGVTPMLSMLRHLDATDDPRPVTLIWGNRTEADILYREELTELADRRADLRIVHVLSEQDDAPGERGFIDRPMLERILTEAERRATVFLCGPPVMMKPVAAALRGLGFSRRQIHMERFAL